MESVPMWQAGGAMKPPVASTKDTLAWFLETSKRQGYVPIHKVFVQHGRGKATHGGPLARFVSAGRERALDLYLLLLLRTAGEGKKIALPSGVWSRAINLGSSGTAANAVSKQWSWLAQQKLIERGRRGRLAEITVLHEDGSGDEYGTGVYLRLPFAYWEDNWCGRLTIPEKATLLIALSLADDFYLPQEKAPSWYGISADSLGRGLRGLKKHGLLNERVLAKLAPGAPEGYTQDHHYTLCPPFGPVGKSSKSAVGGVEVGSE
jgi:hypothetical protein